MPKAAVHEDSQPLLAEDEVGLSKHRLIPSPAHNADSAADGDESQFRAPVSAPAYQGHDLRALSL